MSEPILLLCWQCRSHRIITDNGTTDHRHILCLGCGAYDSFTVSLSEGVSVFTGNVQATSEYGSSERSGARISLSGEHCEIQQYRLGKCIPK